MQCIALPDSTILIAAPDGRCWITKLSPSQVSAVPVSVIAAQRATLAASAIEGAVTLGLASFGERGAPGPYTLPRYIRWLVGNYLFAGQTPGLFRRGAKRFESAGRPDLAQVCLTKAAEESGHARLAFRDLGALGHDAADVVRLVAPPSAAIFTERFRAYVESSEPVALFGFSYCLERMAVERDDAFIRRVEAVCPAESRAVSFLRVHSALGSDNTHVFEQLSLFESFDSAELATVVRAAYETAQLLARQHSTDEALSDEEIKRRLGEGAFRTA